MSSFQKLRTVFLFAIAAAMSASGQVMSVSPSATTGLDVHLSSNSWNYTFYPGTPGLWGHLDTDGYVEFTVASAPGIYDIQVYYSNGTTSDGTVTAEINGASQGSISIPATGSWSKFQMSGKSRVNLTSGQNRLRLAASDPPQAYNLAGVTLTPHALLSSASSSNTSNPLWGSSFYVNPYSLAAINSWFGCPDGLCISKIANQPQGVWLGNWNYNPQNDVATVMRNATTKGTVPILVVYNLPHRDCGGYSSGGAADATNYQDWVQKVALGVGNGKAAIILEPDGLTQYNTPGCLNDAQKDERLSLYQYAISQFAQHAPNAAVYFDAGPPHGISPDAIGQTLIYAGVSRAAGFAVNVSNYESTADSIDYGNQVSASTGGKHFVIDTSRNGQGATADHQFCNPPNRGLGLPSQAVSGGLVDAYLWVQNPGTSDGNCNGNVAAGIFSSSLTWTLLRNSAF